LFYTRKGGRRKKETLEDGKEFELVCYYEKLIEHLLSIILLLPSLLATSGFDGIMRGGMKKGGRRDQRLKCE
jgi:hypothetical protein